ncbi:hypothetical protein pEaSNUABM11_00099 [Erwinia phage pEa_SNUABM_11]|nr:hypothetical protein pEaSNUABM11_00099 [Erwinia phage pEa_SNUABM_11]
MQSFNTLLTQRGSECASAFDAKVKFVEDESKLEDSVEDCRDYPRNHTSAY